VNGNYPQTGWGLVNKGLFTNLLSDRYWSGTEYLAETDSAWIFGMTVGDQGAIMEDYFDFYALAVHEGNVGAPVPLPSALFLFAPGLLGLAAIRRRFTK
jgi:hypothetical protein